MRTRKIRSLGLHLRLKIQGRQSFTARGGLGNNKRRELDIGWWMVVERRAHQLNQGKSSS
jgi:hypothetical protein